MKIFTKEQIKEAVDIRMLLDALEKGFILYSEKKVCSAPVGFLEFVSPPGDVHIKSCYIPGDEYYVVKIASGFYHNPSLGLSSSNGVVLLFSSQTGALQAIFLDEGYLTDLRTALTGALCAKYLAPKNVERIGIIGTGTQARMQLYYLQYVTRFRDVVVWGRSPEKMHSFSQDPWLSGFKIHCAECIEAVTESCNLIVTTTTSKQPLLFGSQIKPGTHITAVGADQVGKQELDATVFEKADLIIADSLVQCRAFGDLAHANPCSAIELGAFLKAPLLAHTISVADLTGLAISDLQLAKVLYESILNNSILLN